MTSHDGTLATPSDDTSGERPNRSLAEQLVEQARADGKNLVGPGGLLLSDLTKQVLETGLEVEMQEQPLPTPTTASSTVSAAATPSLTGCSPPRSSPTTT